MATKLYRLADIDGETVFTMLAFNPANVAELQRHLTFGAMVWVEEDDTDDTFERDIALVREHAATATKLFRVERDRNGVWAVSLILLPEQVASCPQWWLLRVSR